MTWYTARVDSDGSGNGTATFTEGAYGYIEGVRVEYGGVSLASTDTSLTESKGLERIILNLTNVNTDTTYAVAEEMVSAVGTGLSTYRRYYVNLLDLVVTVAGAVATTTDAVVVKVYLQEDA